MLRAFYALLFLLPTGAADQPKLTSAEARKLAIAAMPNAAKKSGVTIELDRGQSNCAVFHAYRDVGEPPFMRAATVGWWSVDLRTGEVWDEVNSKRVTTQQIETIQGTVRKRLGITDEEVSVAISKPCYDRYSK